LKKSRRSDRVFCIDAVKCYVCEKYIPHCIAQPIGNGAYRCKDHRQSTILKKGEKTNAVR